MMVDNWRSRVVVNAIAPGTVMAPGAKNVIFTRIRRGS